MAEFKRPANEIEFHSNFEQIKPLMNDTEAHYESARCLFCYDAPCVKACPTGIDIPLFIRQIYTNNLSGSAKTIYQSNYFGMACGLVCPTEVLCEGACVLNHQHIKPIEIGRLQAFAAHSAIQNNEKLTPLAENNGKKVAVIGAGPAGISCACELRRLGFTVDIFEAKDKPSGLTVYGVAPYKITDEAALNEMAFLEENFGFRIHYHSAISSEEDLKRLEKDFDAIFLGIGLGATAEIKIPGEELENCLGAVEFIEALRTRQHQASVGKNVVILGGGNTAMDAASESARMGAEKVTLCYRRSQEEMRAYEFEFDLAKSVGVQAIFNAAPTEIIGNGRVEAIRLTRTESKNGKLRALPGSEFTLPCDMVIKATGQEKMTEFLSRAAHLALNQNGSIKVNPETGQTSQPKYFAGGDAANGGREVVNAAAEGKNAARGIQEYLRGAAGKR